ncbi:transglutaminase-like domain-containing protein [Methanocaldococcus vulcanius]|nr:transglutaminase-like domain-containing protein [Methanocaldococcus vulcanius]
MPKPQGIPKMIVVGAEHTSYLRVGTYYKYDYMTGTWYGEEETAVKSSKDLEIPNLKYKKVYDDIYIKLLAPMQYIPTSKYTVDIDIGAYYIYKKHTFKVDGQVSSYTIKTFHYIYNINDLNHARAVYDKDYLQVPQGFDKRVYDLAYNITKGCKTDYEKAKAIEYYLKTHYTYDINATPAPSNIDPIEWFLLYSKRGVCKDFNSAFVILARINGLPARLVSGYAFSPSKEPQVITDANAHAWSEVYFEGIGWVRFDATGCGYYPKFNYKIPLKFDVSPNNLTIIRGKTGKINIYTFGVNENDVYIKSPFKYSKVHTKYGFSIILEVDKYQKLGKYQVEISCKDITKKVNVSVIDRTKTTIDKIPTIVKKDNIFYVEGKVLDSLNNPVDRGEVFITLNKTKNSSGIVVGRGNLTNGIYKIKCTLPKNISVGDYEIIAHYNGSLYYLPSNSDPKIKVVSEAEINYTIERINNTYIIKGRLYEKSGDALKNQKIKLIVDNKTYTTYTNNNGEFNYSLNLDDGNHTISIIYEGNNYYLPKNITYTIFVNNSADIISIITKNQTINITNNTVVQSSQSSGIPIYYYLLIVLLSCVIVAGAYKYKHKIKFKQIKKSSYSLNPIKIIFEIPDNIPVWEEGKELTIKIEGVENPELYVDNEKIGNGNEFKLTFNKGIHTITAKKGNIKNSKKLYVVDYSEEIINLYKKFLNYINIRYNPLTPYEIYEQLKSNDPKKLNNLYTITKIFELVKYKRVRVSRDEFINFYSNISKILGDVYES